MPRCLFVPGQDNSPQLIRRQAHPLVAQLLSKLGFTSIPECQTRRLEATVSAYCGDIMSTL